MAPARPLLLLRLSTVVRSRWLVLLPGGFWTVADGSLDHALGAEGGGGPGGGGGDGEGTQRCLIPGSIARPRRLTALKRCAPLALRELCPGSSRAAAGGLCTGHELCAGADVGVSVPGQRQKSVFCSSRKGLCSRAAIRGGEAACVSPAPAAPLDSDLAIESVTENLPLRYRYRSYSCPPLAGVLQGDTGGVQRGRGIISCEGFVFTEGGGLFPWRNLGALAVARHNTCTPQGHSTGTRTGKEHGAVCAWGHCRIGRVCHFFGGRFDLEGLSMLATGMGPRAEAWLPPLPVLCTSKCSR